MDQEIVDYILQAQRHGLQDMEIKQNLLNAGWDANAVEQSFIFAKAADTHSMPFSVIPSAQQLTDKSVQSQKPQVQPAAAAAGMSAATISDQHFAQTPAPSSGSIFKKPAFWIAAVVLLVLAGGAYAYYALVLTNPTKIWQKFTQGENNKVYQTNYNLSYSDPGQYSGANLGFQLKDIKVSLKGSAYLNTQDANNPESSSTLQYTFSSGNTSFSTGLQYILQNKIIYVDVGDNPILNMISDAANGGQKIDWIKINLALLEQQGTSTQDSQAKFYQEISSPDFKTQLEKIWSDATIIKEDKYLGREKINGTQTLHFQNSVDKSALKDLASQYVQKFTKAMTDSGGNIKDSDVQLAKELSAQLIDKIQVKSFETWIGMTDFKLYRVHLVTNAPSVISMANNASNLGSAAANDAKRVADMRQLGSALELYNNDNKGYPEGVNGQPVGLSPTYLGTIPTAPSTNGNCNDFYNTYWYQPMGHKTVVNGKTLYSSYQMTFCLGSASGSYAAGIGKLTPSGIVANIPCPGSAVHCAMPGSADPEAAARQQAKDFISKLDFSAEITADADYSNYGATVPLTAPATSFDVLQKLAEARALARDAKRYSDMRQLASAEELYFNDNNKYSTKLEDLVPKYIGMIPVAPTPADGTCTDAQNVYTYTKKSDSSYKVTFCLGSKTSGYEAGVRTIGEAGIQ